MAPSILLSPDREYQPFPDVARRNFMQEAIEVPLLIRLLRLPPGGRVLEVGCGRGIALSPLAAALRPRQLVGLDVDSTLIEAAGSRLHEKGVNAELRRADVGRYRSPMRALIWSSISAPAITSARPSGRSERSCES